MKENGSPTPIFESDEEHSYFLIRLPIHEGILNSDFSDMQTNPVIKLLNELKTSEKGVKELMENLGLTHRTNFRNNYLKTALEQSLIEMTIPEKPNSRNQNYRLTN